MAYKDAKFLEIHREGVERFETIMSRERDQRALAVEDAKFAHTPDGQWDENSIEKRKDRPRFTINRVAGAIDQLVGDRRQSQTNIKVRPIGGGADMQLAKIYNGLIRNIEGLSKAETAYDMAYDELVTGGYGGWRVLTEFADDDAFEQDIRIHTIDSASTSLFFDPAAKAYDKRDAKFAFLTTLMPVQDFKSTYPDEAEVSFDQERFNSSLCSSWFINETVRIAEYWVKVPIVRNIALMSDGRVIDLDDEKEVLDELEAEGVTISVKRKVKSHRVVMYKMSGSSILEGPNEWAGKYIPLIPAFGKVARIEGKEYVRGLVRNAKDPNRIYNYTVSTEIETTALTPKDPYWITTTQAKGHEVALRTFNIKNQPFVLYNADPAAPGPPARTGAPSVQSALIAQRQNATLDIYATTGIEPASLGNSPELKSGKAIIAQQKMGDRGSFVYADNLNKSIEYTGEILVDLIPRIYDTDRVIRVLNIDGTSEEIKIGKGLAVFNQTISDTQTGDQEIVYDLSRGKYDVVVSTGASFASQREESAQQLIDLTANNPIFASIATDLIAKNLDILESEELTKRVRSQMIQQGLIKPTQDEVEELGLGQPQQPTESERALLENVQMQTEKMMAEITNSDAKTAKLLSEINTENIEAFKTMLENFKAQQEIGIPLSAQDNDRFIKQKDIVAESQNVIDEGPNSEQAADLALMPEQQQLPPQELMPQEFPTIV
tara:strand:- start:4226 stop:6382 length:2157 start_codon:yes stop_codon:yes gene_type:complete